jgi:hypothetical protein
MDAIWFHFGEAPIIVYLLGLRAVKGGELHFLRPVLRPGHESRKRWREIIEEIAPRVRKRISAIVSDSFAGSGQLARQYGWVLQRCQAHLLIRLSTLCGNNKRTVSWRSGRQKIKKLIRVLLETPDEVGTEKVIFALSALGQDSRCTIRLRRIVRATIRFQKEYRACFLHPELRLPATTNALENTNGRIRSLLNRSRGCRTPESLIRWITGFLYFHPAVKCRPKSPTKLRR